ncbi:hypothetical protein ID866_11617 [Astraeus odoratus]|nr:hypothetical protein ID866_11617 [Astraeus odoratus]
MHSKSQLPSHYDDGIPNNSTFEDVLGGSQPLDISHAGGEFQELAKQVLKTVQTKVCISCPNCKDYRTCKDHARMCSSAFEQQMLAATEAYMAWCLKCHQHGQGSFFKELSASQPTEGDICTSQLALTVFDIFHKYYS